VQDVHALRALELDKHITSCSFQDLEEQEKKKDAKCTRWRRSELHACTSASINWEYYWQMIRMDV